MLGLGLPKHHRGRGGQPATAGRVGSVSGELSCLGVVLRPKGRTAARRSLARAGRPPGRPAFGAWSRSRARTEDSTRTPAQELHPGDALVDEQMDVSDGLLLREAQALRGAGLAEE